MKKLIPVFMFFSLMFIQCQKPIPVTNGITFKDDLEFLKQHTPVHVLTDLDQRAQVIVCPEMQGRVMTSTNAGLEGLSFGWINRSLIESGQNNPHINAFGGEDRFWLGPEGGQFSIFFKNNAPFDLEHWYTPKPINEGAFDVEEKSNDYIRFSKLMSLKNYSNTEFDIKVERNVRLLNVQEMKDQLKVEIPTTIKRVAFESENTIINRGNSPWSKDTGLLSIWILGMFNPSPTTTIVVPYEPGPESELGPVVNDAYFGKVPADRLIIDKDVIYFKGDGEYRSKIGLSQQRSKPYVGSYDAKNQVLTIVHYSLPEKPMDYVNSMWEIQDEPYKGDAVNSYNDGPPEPGEEPLGPFYELETSSPAVELEPGAKLSHLHQTYHFQGDPQQLDTIAKSTLGKSIDEIKNAFTK